MNSRRRQFLKSRSKLSHYLKSHLLNFIRSNGPSSRSKLARSLHISPTTVSKFISQLINENLVEEIGAGDSSGGRRPVLLQLKSQMGYALGVDLGSFFTRVVLMDLAGKAILSRKVKTHPEKGQAQVLKSTFLLLRHLIKKSGIPKSHLKGIGFGISGIVDFQQGLCYFCPNLPGWENAPLKKIIESEFKIPVLVDDSVRAATLAEKRYGVARSVDNFVLVSIGAGVGAGIFTDGKLYRGGNGLAGEFGHIPVEENGPRCRCGNFGCLESLVSGPALVNQVRKALGEGVNSSLRKKVGERIDNLTTELIIEAAEEGDKLSFSILHRAAEYIGLGISMLVNLLNPNLVVIGGGMVQGGGIFFETIKRVIRTRSLEFSFRNVKVVPTQLDDNGAAWGAANLILEEIFEVLPEILRERGRTI